MANLVLGVNLLANLVLCVFCNNLYCLALKLLGFLYIYRVDLTMQIEQIVYISFQKNH